ncbi:MAG TPA: PqqD family protein [Chloroflexota bacterium]|nr:PqqD family protein [Chloroflexota bacterium]
MAISQPRLIPSPSVVSADLDNTAVLLNVETGVYFGLDAIGTRIWALLGDGAPPERIVDALLDEYEVERSRLSDDVDAFIAALVAKGLLRIEAE